MTETQEWNQVNWKETVATRVQVAKTDLSSQPLRGDTKPVPGLPENPASRMECLDDCGTAGHTRQPR